MKKIVYSVLMIFAVAFTAHAQNTTVNGTVKSSVDGLPLIGVNVIVKDTSNGAVTDFDGNFTITNIQPNATLVFTYLGFQTKELLASANMDVVLDEDNETLDEIVVIGYGTQKKKEVQIQNIYDVC